MIKGEPKVPTTHLTIFLLKSAVTEDEQAVPGLDALTRHEVDVGLQERAALYIETRRSYVPRWARFFEGQVPSTAFGRVSSAAAVLLVRSEGRVLAVSFGHGRYLLDPNSWEERFGLLVALNSIGEATLRSVDKKTLDPLGTHSRVQTSREAPARAFGIDVEQDLVRAVTGTPDDTRLGTRITGADALAVAVPVVLPDLGGRLRAYLRKSRETSYRDTFPWIDQVAEVKDTPMVAALDEELVRRIRAQEFDACWMAVPEIVDWTGIDGFRFGGPRQGALVPDITFRSLLLEYQDQEIALELLRNRKVWVIGPDDTIERQWSVYRCIYCEVERGDDTFMLSGGKWYQITTDFVREVNTAFGRLPRYEEAFPTFSDGSEEAYNKKVAAADVNRFALMDRRLVRTRGMSDRVEFCDLFTRELDVIHVKRYGGASVLSHLFSQGLVSGELFAVDAAFRTAVRSRLPATHRDLVKPSERPKSDKFRVVFAVISEKSGKGLTLPFFSRVNVRTASRRLEGFGYRVALAKIGVDETYALTRKFKGG
jgi:uncharacterized protein (TIGR04141 family)